MRVAEILESLLNEVRDPRALGIAGKTWKQQRMLRRQIRRGELETRKDLSPDLQRILAGGVSGGTELRFKRLLDQLDVGLKAALRKADTGTELYALLTKLTKGLARVKRRASKRGLTMHDVTQMLQRIDTIKTLGGAAHGPATKKDKDELDVAAGLLALGFALLAGFGMMIPGYEPGGVVAGGLSLNVMISVIRREGPYYDLHIVPLGILRAHSKKIKKTLKSLRKWVADDWKDWQSHEKRMTSHAYSQPLDKDWEEESDEDVKLLLKRLRRTRT